jgi:membrane protein DedA with SNARE-associated domain
LFLAGELPHLIATYGYWLVAGVIALECLGVPLPGETTLIAAAIYAGSHGEFDIRLVIAAAAAGSVFGSTIGFWVGREFGYRLLLRYGNYLRLTESRIKVGQYLFRRHGGKVVFLGRFLPLLRILAALLAGMNCMPWGPFLAYNTAGAVLWAACYGLGFYYLGKEATHLARPLEIGLGTVALLLLAGSWLAIRRYEAQLTEAAERALPGRLRPPRRARRRSK